MQLVQIYGWFITASPFCFRYRIGPFEVESCLLEHPAVAESAVVSSPDTLRGEVVKAFVVVAEEYKTQEVNALITVLQNHVKNMTAPYKYPRKVMILSFIDVCCLFPFKN